MVNKPQKIEFSFVPFGIASPLKFLITMFGGVTILEFGVWPPFSHSLMNSFFFFHHQKMPRSAERCAACDRRADVVGRMRPIPERAQSLDTPHRSQENHRVCSRCAMAIKRRHEPPLLQKHFKRKRNVTEVNKQNKMRRMSARQRSERWATLKTSVAMKEVRRTTAMFAKGLMNRGTNQLSQLAPMLNVLRRLDALRPFQAGGTFVDIGCSVGTVCIAVAVATAGMRVIGIDYKEEEVREARRLAVEHGVAERCTFLVKRAETLRPSWFVGNNVTHVYLMDRCYGRTVREAVFESLAATEQSIVGASWCGRTAKCRWPWEQIGDSLSVPLLAGANTIQMACWWNTRVRVPSAFIEYIKPKNHSSRRTSHVK